MNHAQTAILLLVLALPLQSAAQPSDNNPLTEQSRALQFQISSNFTLSSFQGATLSYKHHLAPSQALRIGFDLSLNDASSDWTQNAFNNDTLTISDNSKRDQANYTIRLNTQAIWYSESSLGISFFYGTGPFLSFSRLTQKEERVLSPVSFPQSKSTSEGSATTWSLGLTGLAGVEWFVSQSISLHAEYGVSLGYSWIRNESKTDLSTQGSRSATEGSANSWQLSGNGVRFGLSVYFQ